MKSPEINLVFAWTWISLGFFSGLLLGLFFHRENWLGGYTSFKRRLLRLGHISFFGLGVVNLCFYFTAQARGMSGVPVLVASWAFIIGGVSMPLCCLIMAHFPRVLPLFSIPVLSLLVAGVATVIAVTRPAPSATPLQSRNPSPRRIELCQPFDLRPI